MRISLASSVLALFVVACGGSDPAEAELGAPVADGGEPGVVPPDAPPITGGCDVTQVPSQNPCVLHESLGVFVSATQGADANDGSRARPYASIAKGIEAGRATKRRVYVCAEAYAEPGITLQNAVPVFGTLSCTGGTWAVGPTHAVLNATTSPAARADAVAAETRIEGLDLVAPASPPGGSSIGLIVTGSSGLHFVSTRIVAQDGADGADGADGVQLEEDAAFGGAAGHEEGSCTRTGVAVKYTYTCPLRARAAGGVGVCRGGGVEVMTGGGGEGGASAPHELVAGTYVRAADHCKLAQPGQTPQCDYWQNERGFPAVATATTNVGAALSFDLHSSDVTATGVAPGLPGMPGIGGTDGVTPAASSVSLSATGYQPIDGIPGSDGQPGQGGGGGFATRALTNADGLSQFRTGMGGPGGGAGGCPGLAGTAGKGGGASIAVLAIGSSFRLDGSVLIAGRGGKGGKGTLGSNPTSGGQPGTADSRGAQAGGAGGEPGVSGHGTSGPAFGLAWSGAQPVVSVDTTLDVGVAREGEPALTAKGRTVPAAPTAIAEKVHAF